MAYWLFKSEPSTFSYDDLVKKGKGGTQWDGVRNYQARNNMRAMKIGDLGFFYHSNEGLDVVVREVPKPPTLDDIKANPKLAKMVLVNNSRLSVQPVADDEWKEVCRMGGIDKAP